MKLNHQNGSDKETHLLFSSSLSQQRTSCIIRQAKSLKCLEGVKIWEKPKN